MPSLQQHDMARRLRHAPTEAERKLWRFLCHDALGVRFRRQHPIPPYVADFACPAARLVVEVDGGHHGEGADGVRDAALRAAGWQVMRFWNNDVLNNAEGVVQRIVAVLDTLGFEGRSRPHPDPPPHGGGGREGGP